MHDTTLATSAAWSRLLACDAPPGTIAMSGFATASPMFEGQASAVTRLRGGLSSSAALLARPHGTRLALAARSPPTPAMSHSAEELQLAAAAVLPLLAYKVAAIVFQQRLQWYLDATIALATAALLAYAAS